jgi:S-layer homology domain
LFRDVKKGDWGCTYIEAALALGIISKNTDFRPDDTVSKIEALKMILRVREIKQYYNTGDWRKDYLELAQDH